MQKEKPPVAEGAFKTNQPTIISLLYLSSLILGITGIIGVVMAYVWRGDSNAEWEESHYTYHIRTFWFGLLFSIIGAILTVVLIGFLILLITTIWFIVRSVVALMAAQKEQPMPNPKTLMF